MRVESYDKYYRCVDEEFPDRIIDIVKNSILISAMTDTITIRIAEFDHTISTYRAFVIDVGKLDCQSTLCDNVIAVNTLIDAIVSIFKYEVGKIDIKNSKINDVFVEKETFKHANSCFRVKQLEKYAEFFSLHEGVTPLDVSSFIRNKLNKKLKNALRELKEIQLETKFTIDLCEFKGKVAIRCNLLPSEGENSVEIVTKSEEPTIYEWLCEELDKILERYKSIGNPQDISIEFLNLDRFLMRQFPNTKYIINTSVETLVMDLIATAIKDKMKNMKSPYIITH